MSIWGGYASLRFLLICLAVLSIIDNGMLNLFRYVSFASCVLGLYFKFQKCSYLNVFLIDGL